MYGSCKGSEPKMFDRLLLAVALLLLTVNAVPTQSHAASASQALMKLCDDYWQGYLEANPTVATGLGDKRYDDRLGDIAPAGIAKEERRLQNALARARAIEEAALPPGDLSLPILGPSRSTSALLAARDR